MRTDKNEDKPKTKDRLASYIKQLGDYLQNNPIKGMEIKKGNR